MTTNKGWYEVQDVAGEWHEITPVQYSAYKCDGVPVRYVTNGMKVCQAVAEALTNKTDRISKGE